MSLSLIMLRAGSADTIIARRLWCIRPSTPTSSIRTTPTAERFALVVSALVPYKRIDLAIDACRLAGVPLKIVGDGPERARLERAAGAGRAVPRPLLRRRRSASCTGAPRSTLLPGEEDFGIVPLEAQACGRPVVALGRGGALETVVPGETGVLVDELDAEAFADGIARARSSTASTPAPSAATPSASAASGSATRWRRSIARSAAAW